MLNADGSATYSNVISITGRKYPALAIYPNPATGNTSLRINDAALIGSTVTVFDINGKQVRSFLINHLVETFDTNGLSAGTYILKLVSGESVKLIKK